MKKMEGKVKQFNSEIFIVTVGNTAQLSSGKKKRRRTGMEVVSWIRYAVNMTISPKFIWRFSKFSDKIPTKIFFLKKLIYTHVLKHMRNELRFLMISKDQLKCIIALNVKTILWWILEENHIDSLSSSELGRYFSNKNSSSILLAYKRVPH